MIRTIAVLAAIVLCTAGAIYADYCVEDYGSWPKSWPKELEPLRKQSRTLVGGQVQVVFYEIPFTTREDFESSWPHLLKVKSKGAPVILLRAPDKSLGDIDAGVRIKCPPREAGNQPAPAAADDATKAKELPEWARTVIMLVVDGDIVDLNRIPLPADTPIIDKRFIIGTFTRKQAEQPAAADLADQSTSLADAVRDFNAENTRRGRGQDQPPLTEEEVVEAINRFAWKRDVPDGIEDEFAAFKAVAETRRLPKGTELEVLTGLQPDAFTLIQLWSIRINLPAPERAAGTVGFTVRHTKLHEEKIDPKSVAWGKPDADGLSLGLFLAPNKDKYQIGDHVQLRLFVRNDGKKAVEPTYANTSHPDAGDFIVTGHQSAKIAVRLGHADWDTAWVSGFMRGRLDPGEAHAFHVPFEIGIGGDGTNKLIGRVIEARPGQTLHLKIRQPNGNNRERADDEPEPESGVVTLTVTDSE